MPPASTDRNGADCQTMLHDKAGGVTSTGSAPIGAPARVTTGTAGVVWRCMQQWCECQPKSRKLDNITPLSHAAVSPPWLQACST